MQTTWIPSPSSHHQFKDTMTDTYTYAVKDRHTHMCTNFPIYTHRIPPTHSATYPHQLINNTWKYPLLITLFMNTMIS